MNQSIIDIPVRKLCHVMVTYPRSAFCKSLARLALYRKEFIYYQKLQSLEVSEQVHRETMSARMCMAVQLSSVPSLHSTLAFLQTWSLTFYWPCFVRWEENFQSLTRKGSRSYFYKTPSSHPVASLTTPVCSCGSD